MPTVARFRTECVAALWDGTRFADARARMRMLADAEAFVRDVNVGSEYPDELVIDRVTRYRPEGVRVGSVVPGHALLHDLTAFILRLSRRDPVDASLRGGALEAADVGRALNVSARTLARFRSAGLVLHHVRDVDGRVRVACFPDSIEAFRSRSVARVDRAGRTVRISADTRTQLGAMALVICAQGGRISLHSLATRLAPACGCSVRTARSVLETDAAVVAAIRLAQGMAQGGVPSQWKGTSRTAAWMRRFAARAGGVGIAPAAVAHWLGIADAAAGRAAVRGRVERMRQALEGVSPVLLPMYVLPDAARSILAPAVVRVGLPVGPVQCPVPARVLGRRTKRALGTSAASLTELQNRGDVALAVAFGFLVWRAHSALLALPNTPIARDVDAIERDLRWAYRIRRAFVERVLPDALVPCVQRLGRGWDEVPESLRMRWVAFAAIECAQALSFGEHSLVAIEDMHLSHIAAHAVERTIARGGPEFAPSNGDDAMALDQAVQRCVPWWHVVCAGDGWCAAAAQTSPEHRRVLDLRFGFDGSAPRTFEEMARELQTSTSRATADWYAAMRAMMRAAIHAMM
jgi:hypothetical protein